MTTETIARDVQELLVRNHVVFAVQGGERTTKADDWACFKWKIAITRRYLDTTPASTVTFDFYCGLAYAVRGRGTPPTPEVVFDSLLRESEAVNIPFGGWCQEWCYSTDSVRAHEVYRECCEIARKLRVIFSADELQQLKAIVAKL